MNRIGETGRNHELVARIHLAKYYSNLKKSKYKEFYDYLGTKDGRQIKIEVKYSYIQNKSAHLIIQPGQFNKLVASKDFVIYLRTNRGQLFIDPLGLLSHAHIHFNKLNPHEKSIVLRIYDAGNGDLKLKELENCQMCDGPVLNQYPIGIKKRREAL